MIHFELLRDRNVVVITPDGPLEKADFEQLAKEVDPFIASKGKLAGLMIHTKSFPGWRNFGAFVSHIKFVVDHHRQIERIAVVTSSGFLKIMPRIADHFVQPKIKHFDFEERIRRSRGLKRVDERADRLSWVSLMVVDALPACIRFVRQSDHRSRQSQASSAWPRGLSCRQR
jgi:hypothetical protein